MEKKVLTIAQKKNRYRALQYTTLCGEYVAIASPFVVMSIVNKDEWFPKENGWKTGLGFTLACLLFFIIVTSITFESEKLKGKKGKYIKLLIGCVIAGFIFYLLRDIMNEIGNILFIASLGIASALGLDIFSSDFQAKADLYKDTIQRGKQKVLQDEVEQEQKNKNDVKF